MKIWFRLPQLRWRSASRRSTSLRRRLRSARWFMRGTTPPARSTNRDLHLRATDLARHVAVDAKEGAADRPPTAVAYQSTLSDIFAVRSQDGRVIGASPSGFGELVAGSPVPTDDASFFRLNSFGATLQDYYGLSVAVSSPAGLVSVRWRGRQKPTCWCMRCSGSLSSTSPGHSVVRGGDPDYRR